MSTIINNHSNADKMADLKKALDRALNTWDDGPRWLFDLCDGLAAGTVTGVTFYEGEMGRGKAVAPLSGNGHQEIYDVIEYVPVKGNFAGTGY